MRATFDALAVRFEMRARLRRARERAGLPRWPVGYTIIAAVVVSVVLWIAALMVAAQAVKHLGELL